MIRELKEDDLEIVCKIVNDNWRSVYAGYVNEKQLDDKGCLERKNRLKKDFLSHRLSNFVYELYGQVIALLSIGDTADKDKKGAFEVWRIYIMKDYQNKGLGTHLLKFAEQYAKECDYKESVIWAFKENHNAVSFYKKHGYVQDKEEYLGDKFSAYGIRFNKKLVK